MIRGLFLQKQAKHPVCLQCWCACTSNSALLLLVLLLLLLLLHVLQVMSCHLLLLLRDALMYLIINFVKKRPH